MSITGWDPFSRAISLRETFDQMFDETLLRPDKRWPGFEEGMEMLSLDVTETDKNLIVKTHLPG